jgi:anhydro-N-acetylmuramic acid kinase
MDHWSALHLGQPYDDGGEWAASGAVNAALLDALASDPYFALAPPKSTGRDHFNPEWLSAALAAAGAPAPRDVQATLAELNAHTCAEALLRYAPTAVELPGVSVMPTDARGLPAMQVEAAAFAWLASAHCDRRPANLPSVTGAAGPRVLGALYPA